MLPLLIGACAVGGLAYVYPKLRERQHFLQLGRNFPRIQQAAFDNDAPSDGVSDVPELIAHQCFRTAIGFQLIYTCDREENGDRLHHLSGQLQVPDDQRLIRNMLIVLGILMGQFEEARIELKDGQFLAGGTVRGTQHLQFRLTEAEHEALRRILSPAPRQALNPGADPELLSRILIMATREQLDRGEG
jgi:hypothetical protein